MTAPVIRTKNLTKRYGKLTAVDGVSLEVAPAQVFALMGRNGAGKTSFIRMLLGLTPISGGEAEVLGRDSAKRHVEIRRAVGYVPETHHMYRWMSIKELADFTGAFYPTWNDALCAEYLRRFELDPAKKVKELSRGMVAKLALTLALAHEPELLILDEPTSGLDAVVRQEFLESIVNVAADEGRTVLISSHLLNDVERVVDRVALMDNGKIKLVESMESLKARMREVRMTFPAGAPTGEKPSGALRLQATDKEWLMVTPDFTPETEAQLRQKYPGALVESRSLTLEEIFVALVRGNGTTEVTENTEGTENGQRLL